MSSPSKSLSYRHDAVVRTPAQLSEGHGFDYCCSSFSSFDNAIISSLHLSDFRRTGNYLSELQEYAYMFAMTDLSIASCCRCNFKYCAF